MPSGAAPSSVRKGPVEIRPASLAQITKARDGQLVQVDDDVQGIANALHEIDHHLRLRFSEAGEYFVAYWKPDEWEEGDGYAIFTAQDLDHRIVHHMRGVYHRCQQPGYSFAQELERAEEKAEAEQDHNWEQQHGEMYEKLAFAMREDLGYNQSSIFVPKDVAA